MPRLGLRPTMAPLDQPFTVNQRSPQYVGLAGWWSSIGGLGRVLVGGGEALVSGAPVLTPVVGSLGYSTAVGDRVRFPLVGTGTGPTGCSLMAWIKTASSSPAVDAYVVTAGQVGETQAPYHILPAYGGLYSGWQDGGGFHQPDAGAIALSTVMLLVVTYDGTNLRVYRDGLLMLTSAQTSTATWTMTSMAVGNLINNTTNSSGGHVVLDARLYRRVLSANDIWQMWAPQTRYDLYRPAKWRTIVQGSAGGAAEAAAGQANGTSTVAGALTATVPIAASSAGASSVAAALTSTVPVLAASAGTSTVTAALRATVAVTATSVGTSTVTGAVTVAAADSGVVAGVSTVSGTLTSTVPIAATSSSMSTLTAAARATVPIAASSAGTSSSTADLTVTPGSVGEQAAGVSAGTSTVIGTLRSQVSLAASAGGVSALVAMLRSSVVLAGTATGTSTLSGFVYSTILPPETDRYSMTVTPGGAGGTAVYALRFARSRSADT